MTGPNLRAAVIGLGGVAIADHIPTYVQHSSTDLVAVADIDLNKAQAVASDYDVPEYYGSSKDLLDNSKIDILSICTPPSSHRDVFLQAAKKHREIAICCEKPLSNDLSDAVEMKKVANNENITTHMGNVLRYNKNFMRVKKMKEKNILEDVDYIHSYYFVPTPGSSWFYNPEISGGGVIMDWLPHLLDYYMTLFSQPIQIKEVEISATQEDQVEDSAKIYFSTGETNIRTEIEWTDKYNLKKNIISTRDSLLEFNESDLTGEINGQSIEYRDGELPSVRFRGLYPIWGQTTDNYHQRRIEVFINNILEDGQKDIIPIEQGVRVLEMIKGIYQEADV